MKEFFKGIVKLTEEQYSALKSNGSLTVGDNTITFDENTLYVTDYGIDDALSATSQNPVMNSVITQKLEELSEGVGNIPTNVVTTDTEQEITGNKYFNCNVQKYGIDLATKNDIPAVVDGLTSTSSTSALSAKQGKLLNDKITSLMENSNGRVSSFTVQTLSDLLALFGLTKETGDSGKENYVVGKTQIAYHDETVDLISGDVFFVIEKSVPDYWYSLEDKTLYQLETMKVDLTNVAMKSDIPTTLPASDVYPWAKEETKPEYNFSEIKNIPEWVNSSTKPTYTASEVGALSGLPSNVVLTDSNQTISGAKVFEKALEIGKNTTSGQTGISNIRMITNDNNNVHEADFYIDGNGYTKITHKNRSVNSSNPDSYIYFNHGAIRYGTGGESGTAASTEYDIITSKGGTLNGALNMASSSTSVSDSTKGIQFEAGAFISENKSTKNLGINSNAVTYFKIEDVNRVIINGGQLRPYDDNVMNLGSASQKWLNIHGNAIYQNGEQVANKSDLSSYVLLSDENYNFAKKYNESLKIIPEEYEVLSYIAGEGTQYIQTDYVPNSNTFVDFEAELYSGNDADGALFGSRDATGSANTYIVWMNNYKESANLQISYSTETRRNSIFLNTKYHTEHDKYKGLRVNNVQIGDLYGSVSSFSTNYNATIFAQSTGGSVDNRRFRGKVYYFKIYENGILLRNYIPCVRKIDGVVGMYETINNTFNTNAGTGTFVKGNVVNNFENFNNNKRQYDLLNEEYLKQINLIKGVRFVTTTTNQYGSVIFATGFDERVEIGKTYTFIFDTENTGASFYMNEILFSNYYSFSADGKRKMVVQTVISLKELTLFKNLSANEGKITNTCVKNMIMLEGDWTNNPLLDYQDWNGKLIHKKDLSDYLPLSGGTMAGNITFADGNGLFTADGKQLLVNYSGGSIYLGEQDKVITINGLNDRPYYNCPTHGRVELALLKDLEGLGGSSELKLVEKKLQTISTSTSAKTPTMTAEQIALWNRATAFELTMIKKSSSSSTYANSSNYIFTKIPNTSEYFCYNPSYGDTFCLCMHVSVNSSGTVSAYVRYDLRLKYININDQEIRVVHKEENFVPGYESGGYIIAYAVTKVWVLE
jgi:hypothetical protein